MKFATYLLAALALATVGVLSARAGDQFGPTPLEPIGGDVGIPKIQVTEARYDWGTVFQGEHVHHSFTVENVGTAPLRIEKVKAG